MPIKTYIHYEEGPQELHTTLKMTIPKKWEEYETDKLKDFFVEFYNKKHPDNTISSDDIHLAKSTGKAIKGNAKIIASIEDREDIYVKPGKSEYSEDAEDEEVGNGETSHATAAAHQPQVRCKNYGCNKMFVESENSPTACKHHASPPIFHDLKKGWSCCPNKMVYDWDEFEKLEGCVTGAHDTTDPKIKFAASPTVAAAATAEANNPGPAPVLKSIDDYNKQNPNAVTAAGQAAKSATSQLTNVPKRTDGKARCVNFGCYQDYVVAENHEKACRHHRANGVFHDAAKFWGCCPDTKKYDFDDFMKIPGCEVSAHRDGSEAH